MVSVEKSLSKIFLEALKPYAPSLEEGDITIKLFEPKAKDIQRSADMHMSSGRTVNVQAQTLVYFNDKVSLGLMRALKDTVSFETRILSACDEQGLYIHDTEEAITEKIDSKRFLHKLRMLV